MTGFHMPLAPSSADRWGPEGCPGSVRMEAQYPEEEETEEQREGTAAHHYIAEMLRGRECPVGSLAPNGVPITDEMVECGAEMIEDIRSTLAAATPGSVLRVEEFVAAPTYVHKDNGGTPDAYILDRGQKHLHLWDYKHGHRVVDPYRCWQLINYDGCIFESEGITKHDAMFWTVTMTICQPRAYAREGSLREWFAQGSEIVALISNLSAAAHVASSPTAPCHTGDHCRDCRAQWDCVANQKVGGTALDIIHGQQSTNMDPAALGLEAKILAQALQRGKDRLAALEARALALVRSGNNVPYHSLEWTNPRPKWEEGQEETAAGLCAMFGVEIARPWNTPITPKQAIKAGVDETVIKPYVFTPPASQKLVRVDDKAALRVFGSRR